jgi:two-component system, OmpR family, response regulator
LNILLAEDDRNFGFILKEELEQEHYRVDLVPNGVEAVLNFIHNPYDFVLLDLRMPRLSGTDALRIIKTINPKVPAITFSGNAGNCEIAESIKCGAIKCLTKPFEISQLRCDIKNCILK